MTRILVVSDIHGNIDALRAINEPCDLVIFLGDIVDYGPDPIACMDEMSRLPALLRVRGNHDNAVASRIDCGCGQEFLHLSIATREYMWSILGEEQLAWLRDAPDILETTLDGRRLLAVHAAPSDHFFKYLKPDTPDEELAAEAALAEADIILTGHSHRPFMRRFGEKLLVNVGSVGQPRDGIPRISYAIIDGGEVELRRADYDVEAAVAKVDSLPLDDLVRRQLIYILRNAAAPPL